MRSSPRPLSVEGVAAVVAERVVGLALDHPARIAIDGPPWAGLDLATPVVEALRGWSRTVVVVSVADYLRPASLRLEHGRDDPDSFYSEWIDVGALEREVLAPTGPGGTRHVLPALWDAEVDRAARAGYRELPADGVVLVTGWFLLRGALPFDFTVHVALSARARARRVPPQDAGRELPAFDRYDEQVRPSDVADIVVRADDPRRPAVVDRWEPEGD